MNDELRHYGVKGKSGRYPLGSGERPYQRGGGSGRSKNYSDDYKEYKCLRSKDHRTLSNSELQKVNNRMNLELNYEKMTRTELSRGKDAAQVILGYAGLVTSAYALYKSPVGDVIRGLIESKRS